MTTKERAGFLRDVAAHLRELGLAQDEAAREAALTLVRHERRMAWVRTRFDRMRELHDALSDFWSDFADRHPDVDLDDPDYPFPEPAEQKLLERVEADIAAAWEDRWPRHLYFTAV
jgi:hypothetical protein